MEKRVQDAIGRPEAGDDRQFMHVEKLEVYRKLCDLHIAICEVSHRWPPEEKYELGSQIRRSSNSSAAQLAEKHDDRHLRNKIEEEGLDTSEFRTPKTEL